MKVKKSRYLRLEESRNRRLYITGIVLPTAMTFTTLYTSVPKFQKFVDDKIADVGVAYDGFKSKIRSKIDERKAQKEAKKAAQQ